MPELHNVSANDIVELFFRKVVVCLSGLAGPLQIIVYGFHQAFIGVVIIKITVFQTLIVESFALLVQLDTFVVFRLHGIIDDSTGQFVECALRGIVVRVAAVILEVTALAILGVFADGALKPDRRSLAGLNKLVCIVVPLQLQTFAYQHAINSGAFRLPFFRQQFKLGTGSKVKVADRIGVHDVFGIGINLPISGIPVIVFALPLVIVEFLTRTVRLDVISVRTRVVVLQLLLILVAFIDCDSGRFGDAFLLLQGLDDFIRVHIFGRDRLLEVCYDLIGQHGFAGDLDITNKKLFILCQRRKDLVLDAL